MSDIYIFRCAYSETSYNVMHAWMILHGEKWSIWDDTFPSSGG